MRSTFEIERAENGQFYFVLKASNGQVVAVSEQYTTKQNCKKGIASVKRWSLFAKTLDKTKR